MNEWWTDKDTQEVIRLWNEGYSAGQIANKFEVTRSSVMGKVARLRKRGVQMRTFFPAQSKPVHRAKAQRKNGFGIYSKAKPPALSVKPYVPHLPAVEEACNKPFLELGCGDCRFPVSEHHYCARQSPDGSSYCEMHRRVVYQRQV